MFIRNKVPCFKQATRVLCPDPKSKFTPWKYTTNLSVGLLRYYANASITSNITQMAEVVKLNCKYNSYVNATHCYQASMLSYCYHLKAFIKEFGP